jgi:hypothetical protein
MSTKEKKGKNGARPPILIEDLAPKSDVKGGSTSSATFGVLSGEPTKDKNASKKRK